LSLIRKAYNSYISDDKAFAQFVKSISGVTPSKLALYKQAFSHRSSFQDAKENNERLELLGDSVIDLLVAEYLFKKYPYREEGFITEMRSKIVNRSSLNAVGVRLGLTEKVNWNKKSATATPKDIAGNTFEALVGALYLDAGLDAARTFMFKRVLKNMIDVDTLEATDTDHKSKLFHYAQRYGKKLTFEIASETLKNRRSYFVISLQLDSEEVATGEGFSKKTAEQAAAYKAFLLLKNEQD
jgi:ribonuclease-3